MAPSILIIEDDKFLAETMAASLAGHNVETRIVFNGELGLAAIETSPPDLLLLDILMPKMDGHEVLKRLRAKKVTFPIIILSNLGEQMNKDACEKMGIAAYFVKSDMNEDDLWPLVSKHLPKTLSK